METLADRLNALAATHNASWTRTPNTDDTVVVRLHLNAGDVVAGVGSTTADAVAHLERRMTAFTAALATE
jgi:hypothetical protein